MTVFILNFGSVNLPGTGDYMFPIKESGNALRLFFKFYRTEIRFVCFFLALLLSLNLLYFLYADSLLENFILPVLVAKPCAAVMTFIDPNNTVYVTGNRLSTFYASFEIIRGCDGIESFFLIVSAFCAYNIPMWQKIPGMLLGLILAYVLNIDKNGGSAGFNFNAAVLSTMVPDFSRTPYTKIFVAFALVSLS